MHSRDGRVVVIAIDFGKHQPEKYYKILLKTGPDEQTGIPRLQLPGESPAPQGNLQGMSSPKIGKTHFWVGE